jgi:gliding motility-associated-like protein
VGTTVITVSTQDGNYEASCDVEVFNETQIPAGFSPNGDGINDYFELTLNRSDTYVLRVFDKSGQVHYLNSDYKNDWDGTASTGPHSGKKVPSGAYFYSLSAKKAGTTNTGYIIIRY